MMKELKYECMKCGICCFEILNSPGLKRIPLYPEEVNNLIKQAKTLNIKFKVMEDLVFPDILNQNILVLTYRIILDNELKCCPFYKKHLGCLIHENKPLSCLAYPLSLKRVDAFNFEISIDSLCKFVMIHYEDFENINSEKLKKIFNKEYHKAEKFYKKNKKLQFEIRKLEAENKIMIPKEINIDDYNRYLTEWERKEFII